MQDDFLNFYLVFDIYLFDFSQISLILFFVELIVFHVFSNFRFSFINKESSS